MTSDLQVDMPSSTPSKEYNASNMKIWEELCNLEWIFQSFLSGEVCDRLLSVHHVGGRWAENFALLRSKFFADSTSGCTNSERYTRFTRCIKVNETQIVKMVKGVSGVVYIEFGA